MMEFSPETMYDEKAYGSIVRKSEGSAERKMRINLINETRSAGNVRLRMAMFEEDRYFYG